MNPGGIIWSWFGGGKSGACVGGLIGGGWLVSTIVEFCCCCTTPSVTVGIDELWTVVDGVESVSDVRFLLPV